MSPETTWQAVGTTWRTDEHRALDMGERLAQRVHRQSRRLRTIVAIEIALTIVMLVLSLTTVARYNAAGTIRIGGMVLLYSAAVWAFALWNRRGVWRPYGETTADFVHLLRVRAERRIRSARFTQIVIGLAVIFVGRDVAAAWRGGFESAWERGAWIAFAVYALSMLAWSIWYERNARREVHELDALARDLTLNEVAPPAPASPSA